MQRAEESSKLADFLSTSAPSEFTLKSALGFSEIVHSEHEKNDRKSQKNERKDSANGRL